MNESILNYFQSPKHCGININIQQAYENANVYKAKEITLKSVKIFCTTKVFIRPSSNIDSDVDCSSQIWWKMDSLILTVRNNMREDKYKVLHLLNFILKHRKN